MRATLGGHSSAVSTSNTRNINWAFTQMSGLTAMPDTTLSEICRLTGFHPGHACCHKIAFTITKQNPSRLARDQCNEGQYTLRRRVYDDVSFWCLSIAMVISMTMIVAIMTMSRIGINDVLGS